MRYPSLEFFTFIR